MKTDGNMISRLVLIALIFFIQPTATSVAQSTAFTYQGKLNDGTNAAQGIYDLRFTIYDALANGSAVAGPLTNSPVGVTNGLFTIVLDFGAGVFNGDERWLEISVRTNGTVAFIQLAPRQAFYPIPYAMYAMNARLEGAYTNVLSLTNSGNVIAGGGAGLANLNGSEIEFGTINDARLSTNVALLNNNTNRFSGKMIVNNNLIVVSNISCRGNIYATDESAAGKGTIAATRLHANEDIYTGGPLTFEHTFGTNGTSLWTIQNGFVSTPPFFWGLLDFVDSFGWVQMQLWDGPQGGMWAKNISASNITANRFMGDGGGLTNISAVPRMLVLTNSGTFIVTNNMRVMVEVWGGGGGGSGKMPSYVGGNFGAGGGYGKQVFDLTPGSYDVVVGNGGVGGVGENSGGDGGNSSFGSLITSYGGSGGPAIDDPSSIPGGGSTGTFNITGQDVEQGLGFGGSAPSGGFGARRSSAPGGEPGGGGGPGDYSDNPSYVGGHGGKGRVVIYY